MPDTVLVTGGTGFIGAHLAKTLVNDGHDVVVFDVQPDHDIIDRLGITDAVRIVGEDVTDLVALANEVRSSEVTRIVHLAALLKDKSRSIPRKTTHVNVLGAINVLEAARLYPGQIARVVLASSETVYAPRSRYEDKPVRETALVLPDSPYSASKQYSECMARAYREQYGVPVVFLRPTAVFGPFRETFTTFADLFERPAVDEPTRVANGGTTVSWLYVKDAADAFELAALAAPSDLTQDVYNVRGEVATVETAAATVRDVIPEAEVTVTDREELDWSVQNLSLAATRSDLGYEITYDLPALIRDYANAIREKRGLKRI